MTIYGGRRDRLWTAGGKREMSRCLRRCVLHQVHGQTDTDAHTSADARLTQAPNTRTLEPGKLMRAHTDPILNL